MQMVDLYIDTNIKGPKRKWGCYLYVLSTARQEGSLHVVKGMEQKEDTTEHQLTVLALRDALKRFNRPCRLTIWLNPPYVAAVLENGWYRQWQEAGWVTTRQKPVCDVEAWQVIHEKLVMHEYEVRLREHHSFAEWMQWILRDVQENNFVTKKEKVFHSDNVRMERVF